MREHYWTHIPSSRGCRNLFLIPPFRDEELRKQWWPMSWCYPCAQGVHVWYSSEETQACAAVLSLTVSFWASPLALSRGLLCSASLLSANGLPKTFDCLLPCFPERHVIEWQGPALLYTKGGNILSSPEASLLCFGEPSPGHDLRKGLRKAAFSTAWKFLIPTKRITEDQPGSNPLTRRLAPGWGRSFNSQCRCCIFPLCPLSPSPSGAWGSLTKD